MTPRPQKYDLGPTIAVETDGLVGAWCDGHFRGDPELLNEARFNIKLGYQYQLFGTWVTCGDDNPLGIAAALCSYKPGRARLLEAPEDVIAVLSFDDYLGGAPDVP
jgi:hypothetical protein